jgi:uncharacterized membrane protein YqjE
MAVPEGSGPGASPGLFASLRSFWSVLVAILYSRLDLVTAELEEEGIRLVKFILAGLVSVLFLCTAFFFAMYFIIACYWDTEYRLLVIGCIFGVYFIIGVLLLIIAYRMIVTRPKFLSQTLAELRRDVEGLRHAAAVVKKEEPKP